MTSQHSVGGIAWQSSLVSASFYAISYFQKPIFYLFVYLCLNLAFLSYCSSAVYFPIPPLVGISFTSSFFLFLSFLSSFPSLPHGLVSLLPAGAIYQEPSPLIYQLYSEKDALSSIPFSSPFSFSFVYNLPAVLHVILSSSCWSLPPAHCFFLGGRTGTPFISASCSAFFSSALETEAALYGMGP